ncbi:hypothetical protein [Acinetobacter larvae]|uniref:Uncharacterized protein n=1 Tax=Acinetobacter larvae TaxID=1789224 RepID=A0A1B2LZU5_9GAMM|nr:hypothetical protein [Acinetobacter larvae]AOA58431.1 hypothetical protein BFG52_08735 [Acinetobacter larvae]
MFAQILNKQLDESQLCPICRASMFYIEAEEYDKPLNYFQCSHCQHQIYIEDQRSCHCEACQKQRKKQIQATRLQEQRLYQQDEHKDEYELQQLNFMQQLFLLSLLDETVQEGAQYTEYLDWEKIKYYPITPNYYFQYQLLQQLLKQKILISRAQDYGQAQYYLNLRLDGYREPSLFSVVQQLRLHFYHHLSRGLPFKSADEVQSALKMVLYQEVIQFMQYYCKTWGVQIAGNRQFQQYCFTLLDHLAVGQIYYLLQNALEYLHQQKALQAKNDNFINTNILRKTIQQYRERGLKEKWETPTLPRPQQLPLSQMSLILFYKFLGYDDHIFFQPMLHSWKKIEPRLKFYSQKRCMNCGSEQLRVEYDAQHYVSLCCELCNHQDHYFTQ